MAKYARNVNGIVQEVFVPMAGFAIEDCFTPEVVGMFRACPDDVEAGWIYDAGADSYSRPPQET